MSLQIENIWEECYTDGDIKMALATLPKDLDETYFRCLRRINAHHRRFAPRVLRWVCVAAIPFTIDQLREALAIDPQTGLIHQDQIPPAQEVIRCCANLVVRDKASRVFLAHHSVRQFLQGQSDESFDPLSARLELGQLCIAHVCSSTYGLALQYKDNAGSSTLRLNPKAVARLTKAIPSVMRLALPKPGGVRVAIPLEPSNISRPVYLPSFFHFARNQWALLTRDIDRQSHLWTRFRTLCLEPNLTWRWHPWKPLGSSIQSHYLGLLGWAITNRHLGMLDLLLDSQAPELQREIFEMPLHLHGGLSSLFLAARVGDKQVFARLLQRCKTQKTDKDGQVALHHAAEVGSLDVITLLSRTNWFDPDARNNMGKTPVHLAAQNGHVKAIGRLIELGADAYVRDQQGLRAADIAIADMDLPVISVFFVHQRDPQLRDFIALLGNVLEAKGVALYMSLIEYEMTANPISTRTACTAAVRLLLDRDDDEALSPLYLASKHGYLKVAELLMDGGADYSDPDGLTPIFAAAEHGHEEVVKLLLDRNAIVMPGLSFMPFMPAYDPLCASARKGRASIVRLLLDYGWDRDLDAEGHSFVLEAALKQAEENHQETTVRLLRNRERPHWFPRARPR